MDRRYGTRTKSIITQKSRFAQVRVMEGRFFGQFIRTSGTKGS